MSGAAHGNGPIFYLFGLEVNSITTTMWGIMIVLAIGSILLTRNLQLIPIKRKQIVLELILEKFIDFFGSIIGCRDTARKYLPLLGSLFILILVSNYSGLLPGAGHINGFMVPTSTLSCTVALALIVFVTSHAVGFKSKGIKYLKHFIEPSPAMLPLNIMDELIKPLSLSLRLYGNIYAEETLIASVFALIPLIAPLPFMFISVFFGAIQALVFTLLTATYLGSSTKTH